MSLLSRFKQIQAAIVESKSSCCTEGTCDHQGPALRSCEFSCRPSVSAKRPMVDLAANYRSSEERRSECNAGMPCCVSFMFSPKTWKLKGGTW